MHEPLYFPEGVMCPVKCVSIAEHDHGRGTTHWLYEFEPDLEQGAELLKKLALKKRHPSYIPPSAEQEAEAHSIGGVDQGVLVNKFTMTSRYRLEQFQVGQLYDPGFTPRDGLAQTNFAQRLLDLVNGIPHREAEDEMVGVVIVPLCDLEAAEYDAIPDIEGLPDLGHIDEETWRNASMGERLMMIAQTREDDRD